MDLKPWNPWQEVERVQAEVESLLSGVLEKLRHVVPGKAIAFVPVTDIIEVPGEYRLYISLPGMLEEDIDITVKGNTLILRGEREPPYEPTQVIVHHRQWKHGYFERRIQLPEEVDGDSISAAYDAGVLVVRLPRRGVPRTPPPEGQEGGNR